MLLIFYIEHSCTLYIPVRELPAIIIKLEWIVLQLASINKMQIQ
jgi:hypothetical protein